MNPRVWFKSISLENVRSFGTKQTINFTDKDGNAARWNVILGDNGTGKTTVLKGLVVAFYASELEKKYVDSLSRNIDQGPKIDINLGIDDEHIGLYMFRSLPRNKQYNNSELYTPNTMGHVYTTYDTDSIGPNLFAYGAGRKIGNGGLTQENVSSIISLFNEDASLINAEEWLVQTDYLRLRYEAFEKKFNAVYKVIETLFYDEAPGGKMFDTSLGAPQVKLCTHYGAIRFHDLSLGYKTLIAWTVDFAKGLFDRYTDSENPLVEPAVCLVDEIDLHLHPKFQRNIIQFLTGTFPNTQFIVTAHSPLIVQSAEDANIILLKREGNETHVADGIDVHSWRIDQILSSDLFGGIGGRAPQIEEKMTRRRALLRKDERTHEEQLELDELEKELGELPVMETREALKAIDIISKAVISER